MAQKFDAIEDDENTSLRRGPLAKKTRTRDLIISVSFLPSLNTHAFPVFTICTKIPIRLAHSYFEGLHVMMPLRLELICTISLFPV